MSDYADIDREFQNYQDRIADLEARIEALEAALREIATECSTFPVKDGLAFRCESIARAVLAPEQDKCPSDK